jgi:hypothetical protein
MIRNAFTATDTLLGPMCLSGCARDFNTDSKTLPLFFERCAHVSQTTLLTHASVNLSFCPP